MIAAYKWKYHSSSIIEGICYQKKKKKKKAPSISHPSLFASPMLPIVNPEMLGIARVFFKFIYVHTCPSMILSLVG